MPTNSLLILLFTTVYLITLKMLVVRANPKAHGMEWKNSNPEELTSDPTASSSPLIVSIKDIDQSPYFQSYFFGTYIDEVQAIVLEQQAPTILHLFYSASSGMSETGHHTVLRQQYDGEREEWSDLEEVQKRMFEPQQEAYLEALLQKPKTQYSAKTELIPVEKSQLAVMHPYQYHEVGGYRLVSVVEVGSYEGCLGVYHKKDQQWTFIKVRPGIEGRIQCWTFSVQDTTGQSRNIVAILEGWEHHSLYFITLT